MTEKTKADKKTAKAKADSKPYTVTKKRSGRYMVVDDKGKPVNGPAKVEILVKEGLIKKGEKKTESAEPNAG